MTAISKLREHLGYAFTIKELRAAFSWAWKYHDKIRVVYSHIKYAPDMLHAARNLGVKPWDTPLEVSQKSESG